MHNLIPINNTLFSDYFDQTSHTAIHLLKEKIAQAEWQCVFGPSSTCFFDLADDHWLCQQAAVQIGRWIEDYNNDNIQPVQQMLSRCVNWPDHIHVWFCLHHRLIFQTRWNVFRQHWKDFLSVADDCPILLPCTENSPDTAIIFTPLGEIKTVSRHSVP